MEIIVLALVLIVWIVLGLGFMFRMSRKEAKIYRNAEKKQQRFIPPVRNDIFKNSYTNSLKSRNRKERRHGRSYEKE